MDENKAVRQTAEYIRKRLSGESSGHDWWHVSRVYNLAVKIAKKEKADIFVVKLSALLHDIADYKFHKGNESIGLKLAENWLDKIKVDEKIKKHVIEIIKEMSFKGAKVKSRIKTKEGMIVQDADRLDALGAIGIARTFATGARLNREIYNPEIKPEMHKTAKQYKKHLGTTINHFFEKLLLLKRLMNTKTARKIAEKRHRFMQRYLEQFFAEWKGSA